MPFLSSWLLRAEQKHSETTIASFEKKLVDFEKLLQRPESKKPDAMPALARARACMAYHLFYFNKMKVEITPLVAVQASQGLESCITILEETVYGAGEKGQSWRHELNLKASWKELEELVVKKNLVMPTGTDALQLLIKKVQDAKDKDKVAKQAIGTVVNDDTYQVQDVLMINAATLVTEVKLLALFAAAKPESPSRQALVAEIRFLRSFNVKEKDVIHPALFAQAHELLRPKQPCR